MATWGDWMSHGCSGCAHGHEFWRTARSVVPTKGQPSRFCHKCSPSQRMSKVTIEDVEEIVQARGGGSPNRRIGSPRRQNFLWFATWVIFSKKDWEHLSGGNGVRFVRKGSKSEEIARVVFQTLFGRKFKKVRPEWLRYPQTGRLLELDGYNADLKIAFEYQGAQHRDWQIGNEGKVWLQKRLERDEWKRKQVRAQGISLVELWDTTPYEDFGPEIRNQLLKLGRKFDQIDFDQVVSFDSAFIRDDRLAELRTAVNARNIALLSSKWIGVHSKYDFCCDKCDHRWSQAAASYLYQKVAGARSADIKTGPGRDTKA